VKTKNEKLLPKMLPGTVCAQMVRCGKPSCRCARGELHGPYFYRFVWQGGKQRKIYVKQQEAAQVRQACEMRRENARAERSEFEANRLAVRRLLADLAELEKQIAQLDVE
jgi:hypothetical protein